MHQYGAQRRPPRLAAALPLRAYVNPEFVKQASKFARRDTSAARSRQDGLALVLDYAPAAASPVRDLVAREQACCAFLAFRLEETPRAVQLTVTAPAEVGEALDAVFAPFLAGR